MSLQHKSGPIFPNFLKKGGGGRGFLILKNTGLESVIFFLHPLLSHTHKDAAVVIHMRGPLPASRRRSPVSWSVVTAAVSPTPVAPRPVVVMQCAAVFCKQWDGHAVSVLQTMADIRMQ